MRRSPDYLIAAASQFVGLLARAEPAIVFGVESRVGQPPESVGVAQRFEIAVKSGLCAGFR